jgi:hypothetical protein
MTPIASIDPVVAHRGSGAPAARETAQLGGARASAPTVRLVDEPMPYPECGALLWPLDTERGRLWYEVVHCYRTTRVNLPRPTRCSTSTLRCAAASRRSRPRWIPTANRATPFDRGKRGSQLAGAKDVSYRCRAAPARSGPKQLHWVPVATDLETGIGLDLHHHGGLDRDGLDRIRSG